MLKVGFTQEEPMRKERFSEQLSNLGFRRAAELISKKGSVKTTLANVQSYGRPEHLEC